MSDAYDWAKDDKKAILKKMGARDCEFDSALARLARIEKAAREVVEDYRHATFVYPKLIADLEAALAGEPDYAPSFFGMSGLVKRSWMCLWRGGIEQVCSSHKTFVAALRAAVKCERAGGADHRIVEVIEAIPYGKGKFNAEARR